jgi:hypothetical protein
MKEGDTTPQKNARAYLLKSAPLVHRERTCLCAGEAPKHSGDADSEDERVQCFKLLGPKDGERGLQRAYILVSTSSERNRASGASWCGRGRAVGLRVEPGLLIAETNIAINSDLPYERSFFLPPHSI